MKVLFSLFAIEAIAKCREHQNHRFNQANQQHQTKRTHRYDFKTYKQNTMSVNTVKNLFKCFKFQSVGKRLTTKTMHGSKKLRARWSDTTRKFTFPSSKSINTFLPRLMLYLPSCLNQGEIPFAEEFLQICGRVDRDYLYTKWFYRLYDVTLT